VLTAKTHNITSFGYFLLVLTAAFHMTYRSLERLRIILCQLVLARRKNIKLYIFVKGEYLRS